MVTSVLFSLNTIWLPGDDKLSTSVVLGGVCGTGIGVKRRRKEGGVGGDYTS